MKFIWLCSFGLAVFRPVAALGEQDFCPEPDYTVRAPAPLPDSDLSTLLDEDERARPGAFVSLFEKPGPYGHNELGFRYLARAFGYPGPYRSRYDVETWLAEREALNPEYRGTYALWKKWVREPVTRLRSQGAPRDHSVGSYFDDPVDSVQLGRCLATDLAKMRCENSIGAPIEAGARVYYGRKTSRKPCAVHYNGNRLENELPDSMTAKAKYDPDTHTYRIETEKSWSWDFRKFDGGAAAGAAPAK
jgi:hypothetical protein